MTEAFTAADAGDSQGVEPSPRRSVLARSTVSLGTSSKPGNQTGSLGRKPFDPQGEKRRGRIFLFFGVLLPLAAMLFEVLTHFCARHFFDPFPSPWHLVLFSLIPLSNFLSWLSTRRDMSAHYGFMSLLSGMAMGIGALYTLMFLPLTPSACMYTLVFGFGLLGLAPMLSLPCSWLTGKSVTRMAEHRGTYFNAHQVEHIGHLIVLVMVVAIELPSTLTRVNLATACGVDEAHVAVDVPPPVPVPPVEESAQKPGSTYGCVEPMPETMQATVAAQNVVPALHFVGLSKEKQGAINWLRQYGNQETMLRACYERSGKATDILGSLYESGHRISVDEARKVFYLVTGKPYNSVPIPKSFRATVQHAGLMRESDPLNSGITDEFDRDTDMAGESVAGVARGLSIAQTKIVGVADPDSALARLTWTFSFKNDSKYDREGRAKILLPKDAVVSKATLTVNGKEREAKVMARSEARAIYRQALVERKDPLLVSYCGRDQILVQCFPIDGGSVMQVKLQIDAPLTIDGDDKGALVLPVFIERNFVADAPYVVDIASPRPVTVDCAQSDKSPQPGHYGGIVNADQMAGFKTIAHFDRDRVLNTWTDAGLSFLNNGSIIERKIGRAVYSPTDRLYVVIDGSIGMAPYFGEIAAALKRMPAQLVSRVVIVGDEVENLTLEDSASLEKIRTYNAKGGHDDLNALVSVLSSCNEFDRVVWIHSAQPLAEGGNTALADVLNKFSKTPKLFDMALVAGPNEVLGTLDCAQLERVPRNSAIAEDLLALSNMFDTQKGRPVVATSAVATVSCVSPVGCNTPLQVKADSILKFPVISQPPVPMSMAPKMFTTFGQYHLSNLNQGRDLGRKAGPELTDVFAALSIRSHQQGDYANLLPVSDGQLAESLSIVTPLSSAVVTSPDVHESIKTKEVTLESFIDDAMGKANDAFSNLTTVAGNMPAFREDSRSANVFDECKDAAPVPSTPPVYESKQENGQALGGMANIKEQTYGGAKNNESFGDSQTSGVPFNGPVAAPVPAEPLMAQKKGQLQGTPGAAGNADYFRQVAPRDGESQEEANNRVTLKTLNKLKADAGADKPTLQGATNGVVTGNRYKDAKSVGTRADFENGSWEKKVVSNLNNLSQAAGSASEESYTHPRSQMSIGMMLLALASVALSILLCVKIWPRIYKKED